MSLSVSVAVYLTCWWIVFLSILPLGVVSHAEAGIKPEGGGDPASPIDPKIKRKVVTTTWVSAIVFAVIWLVLHFHLIHVPAITGAG